MKLKVWRVSCHLESDLLLFLLPYIRPVFFSINKCQRMSQKLKPSMNNSKSNLLLLVIKYNLQVEAPEHSLKIHVVAHMHKTGRKVTQISSR